MSDLNDCEYYVGRADAARALAEAANDKAIAAIHLAMAVKYDELAKFTDAANESALRPVKS